MVRATARPARACSRRRLLGAARRAGRQPGHRALPRCCWRLGLAAGHRLRRGQHPRAGRDVGGVRRARAHDRAAGVARPAAGHQWRLRPRLSGGVPRAAAGVKRLTASRSGFDMDHSRPDGGAVRDAASRWIDATQPAGGGGPARLDDQVLLRFGLHAAVDLGLPIQVHTGLGDRDLDLHKVNPLLLLDFLRIPEVAEVPVVLLHCYPYHREAGYLAQAFHNVYFDVGLSVNFLGARSLALVAESFELAPFAKQLYPSDAWGPPELHYLGAVLWRRAMATTLGGWVDAGDWSAADAARVAAMVAGGTARRVYGLA